MIKYRKSCRHLQLNSIWILIQLKLLNG